MFLRVASCKNSGRAYKEHRVVCLSQRIRCMSHPHLFLFFVKILSIICIFNEVPLLQRCRKHSGTRPRRVKSIESSSTSTLSASPSSQPDPLPTLFYFLLIVCSVQYASTMIILSVVQEPSFLPPSKKKWATKPHDFIIVRSQVTSQQHYS
jgi:hypothetical protein